MFVSQAHSFTQQARLAITLATVAGYTNILTILTCGTVTSHVSGTTSELGRDVASGAWEKAGFALFLLGAFFVGAAASGVCTETGRRRGWESIYVLPIAVEAALLAMFAVGVELHNREALFTGAARWWMTGLASSAMGLQNATITRISSGVVRTTHVTGVLTDLGLELTQFVFWVRDKGRDIPPGSGRALVHSLHVHPSARRLALLASIVGSFALGAGLGAWAFGELGRWSMAPPVMLLIWIIYQDVAKPIAEIEPSALVGGEGGLNLPEEIALYHLRRDSRQSAATHRMPDLLAWSERLPPAARVVVLDLADVARLDANAALELRSLILRLSMQKRRLIISGINGEQYETLRRWGAGDTLDPSNVCPDLELAIARGISLMHG